MPECGEPGCCEANADKLPTVAAIEAALREGLDAEHVAIVDENGDANRLRITVVSAQFEGKPLLAQHRLVNAAAKDMLQHVHAFQLKTYSPAKWAQA